MLSPQGDQGFLSRIESNPSVHPLITFENTAVLPPSVMVFSLSQLSTVKRDFCPPCALWSIRARTCDQASYFNFFHIPPFLDEIWNFSTQLKMLLMHLENMMWGMLNPWKYEIWKFGKYYPWKYEIWKYEERYAQPMSGEKTRAKIPPEERVLYWASFNFWLCG